MSSSFLRKLE
jgi:hypothetical protein